MNSVLLWLGGILVAILTVLFAAPMVIDWNAYRGVFEEEASRVLGRDVRVGGKVDVRLLPVPYVRFEKVRISNAAAAVGEPFFRVDAFNLWLSTAPLLRGAFEARQIELVRPVLRLGINPDGSGNWESLQIKPGALPFVPSDVVLQEIVVRDGAISVRTQGAMQPLDITGVNGALSAESLDGPYRFRGTINWLGAQRHLRLATSKPGKGGQINLRTTLIEPKTGSKYRFNGLLSELSPRGQVSGNLSGSIRLLRDPLEATGGKRADALELKAKVQGHVDHVRLNNLAIAFEQSGQPQIITGDVSLNWRSMLRLEARLASRWLDLSRLARASGSATPIVAIRRLITRIGSNLPREGTTLARMNIDQVNLGADSMGNVYLALARTGGVTSIGELRAALPGKTKLSLRGTLTAADGDETFEGQVVVHGTSYRRFLQWATAQVDRRELDPKALPVRTDGPFAFASRMTLSPAHIKLDGANIELGNSNVVADADWRWQGDRHLNIDLKGPRVDLSPLFAGMLALPSAADPRADEERPQASEETAITALVNRARSISETVGDLRLKATTPALSDGSTTINDVQTDLALVDGKLTVHAIAFRMPQGGTVDLSGQLDKVTSHPHGQLRGWLTATTPEAVGAVATAFSYNTSPIDQRRLGWADKANLGFNVTVGGATPDGIALAVRGAIGQGSLDGTLRLDGGLSHWRQAPVDLAFTLNTPRPLRLLRTALTGAPAADNAQDQTRAGHLRVVARGPSASALVADWDISAGQSRASYDGTLAVGAGGTLELRGDLNVATPDIHDLFAIASADKRSFGRTVGFKGAMSIVRGRDGIDLRSPGVLLGASQVAGFLTLESVEDKLKVGGRLRASQSSFQTLLALALDAAPSDPAASQAQADALDGAAQSIWPDTPFSLSLADSLTGEIELSTPAFLISDGLKISGATAKLTLAPGQLAIEDLQGSAVGGRVLASLQLRATDAGAHLEMAGKLEGAKLNQLGQTGWLRKPSQGRATINIKMSGNGLSPRGLVSVLSGRGQIALDNVRAVGIAAGSVNATALALVDDDKPINLQAVQAELGRHMRTGVLTIGSKTLPVKVRDGVAMVDSFTVATKPARVRNTTVVELSTLKADSSWRVEPTQPVFRKVGTSRPEPLPAIDASWTGPLHEIVGQQPQLSAAALERELVTRKLERDAERLELLRQQDQSRSGGQTDRWRQYDGSSDQPRTVPQSGAPVIRAPFPIPLERRRRGGFEPSPQYDRLRNQRDGWRPQRGPGPRSATDLPPARARSSRL